jgi:hypothetical protein
MVSRVPDRALLTSRRVYFLAGFAGVIVLSGLIVFLLLRMGGNEGRLVGVGSPQSYDPFADITVSIEATPDFLQRGVQAEYWGRAVRTQKVAAVFQKETWVIKLRLTAEKDALEQFSYSLFDEHGKVVGQAQHRLDVPIKGGEQRVVEIAHSQVPVVRRILLGN